MRDLDQLIKRAEQVLEHLEAILPPRLPAPDWEAVPAYRWRKRNGRGFLQQVTHPHRIRLADLQGSTSRFAWSNRIPGSSSKG
jgi:predicted AAA+ superfamily ATPase